MPDFPAALTGIAKQIESGERPEKVTVRTLLEWFGAQRRGFYVVENIRGTLAKLNMRTDPDFESAFIDALVDFVPSNRQSDINTSTEVLQPTTSGASPVERPEVGPVRSLADPTHRIGKLASANNPPLSVKPDATVEEAVTLMLSHDFSQLPVMQTERDLKGVVSWASIGSRLALGRHCEHVRECMEPPREISADTSLFAAIDTIVAHEYVLVRDPTRKIVGIVTTSDLSLQFLQLGEPFLLLGEIENHIRRLISGRFSGAELSSARDPVNGIAEVSDVSDLTFGEYIRLLENPGRWTRLGLAIDRGVFLEQLGKIRLIRNDVMHFDPDGIAPLDLEMLRRFVRFMQGLRTIGITA